MTEIETAQAAKIRRLSGQERTASLVDAIIKWCASMHGTLHLKDGLRGLADAIECDLISVTRIRKDRRKSSKPIIVNCGLGDKLQTNRVRSFAPVVLGGYLFSNRPGTTWLASMLDCQDDQSLRAFQVENGLRELLIIPLEVDKNTIDLMDIHFSQRLDPELYGLLTLIAPALSQSWKDRCTGMFTEHILEETIAELGVFCDPILSTKNPARLTRVEFRLCSLIRVGQNTKAISASMHISASTVRSHLRSIYSKTKCHSFSELTHLLLSDKASGSPVDYGPQSQSVAAV